MKRHVAFLLSLLLLLPVSACGTKGPTWQEQYDLGVKYLEEGSYGEAVLAFTAAIEIDPKRAPAYVGRGDAYVGSVREMSVEVPEYAQAEADYLSAIDLDMLVAEIYEKLANLYLAVGDVDRAIAILEQGYAATGHEPLNSRRQELGLSAADEVVWTDPVFERLIREKIGIPTGPVYVQDLDEITSLEIYGDQAVFINDESSGEYEAGLKQVIDGDRVELFAFYGRVDLSELYTVRGAITDVTALRYFRNLSWVLIVANHITDVSVLRELPDLQAAYFWGNDIADLSPVYEVPNYSEHEEQFVEIGDISELKSE